MFKRLWTRGHGVQDARGNAILEEERKKGKQKERQQIAKGMQEASDTNSKQQQNSEAHAMRRLRFHTPAIVSSARAKMRVYAAGERQPREGSRDREAVSDSDEDEDGDDGDTPAQPDGGPRSLHNENNESDDESVHGFIDVICFCLCLPCCK